MLTHSFVLVEVFAITGESKLTRNGKINITMNDLARIQRALTPLPQAGPNNIISTNYFHEKVVEKLASGYRFHT